MSVLTVANKTPTTTKRIDSFFVKVLIQNCINYWIHSVHWNQWCQWKTCEYIFKFNSTNRENVIDSRFCCLLFLLIIWCFRRSTNTQQWNDISHELNQPSDEHVYRFEAPRFNWHEWLQQTMRKQQQQPKFTNWQSVKCCNKIIWKVCVRESEREKHL